MYVDEDDVLRLDVAMDDLLVVHVPQPIQHLTAHNRRALLREPHPSTHKIIQLPVYPQFFNQINILLVGKHTIQLNKVWVRHMQLQLDLAEELVVLNLTLG